GSCDVNVTALPARPTCTLSAFPSTVASGAWSNLTLSTSSSVSSVTINSFKIAVPQTFPTSIRVWPEAGGAYAAGIYGPSGSASCQTTIATTPIVAPPANAVRPWIPNGPINSMAANDNTLFLGGSFNHVGPYTGSLAQLDSASG